MKSESTFSASSSEIVTPGDFLLKLSAVCCEYMTTDCIIFGSECMCSAYAPGSTPMRMSISRPCPFWPSLEPCAKLTPVQVRISSERTHSFGGCSPSGAW